MPPITVVTYPISICGRCYMDHEGPCPTGPVITPNVVNPTPITVKKDEETTVKKNNTKKASAQCCGSNNCHSGSTAAYIEELERKLAAKENRFKGIIYERDQLRSAMVLAEHLVNEEITKNNKLKGELSNLTSVLESARSDFARLVLEHEDMMDLGDRMTNEAVMLLCRHERVLDAVGVAHDFARGIYYGAHDSTCRGAAAEVIVELGDAVGGGVL